ncbi:MAG TPA: hypothetical protein PKD61_23665 [Polyangiaceae bacterium]|nr:hypothetical protein [Polyangiaceae bacterium]
MKRRCVSALVALGFTLACSSCSSDDGPVKFSADKMKSNISAACEAKFVDALHTLRAAKACDSSADCEFRPSNGLMVFEHCRAGNYVNPSAAELSGQSLTELEAIEEELPKCLGNAWVGLGCLGSSATPATCWHGRCWVDVAQAGLGKPREQCADDGPAGTCTDCLCAHCPTNGAKCFSDPDCRALFECTLASGALGRYAILDFDVANPPCPELLKKSGGAQGDAAKLVTDLWSCNLKSGCFAVCDGEIHASILRERGPTPSDVAIPVDTDPGKVPQVDFGYAGSKVGTRALHLPTRVARRRPDV